VGVEVYQVEFPPRAEHCSPEKAGGLVTETQMIVQEEEEEDPGSGGDPEMVPGQEQSPEEGGLESGHRPGKQREPTSSELQGIPLTLKPVPISQIRPTIGFMVELVVQGVSVQAVVDTGAEVSVLSKRVYDQLDPKPSIKQYVTMTQTGENAKMNGFIVGPVEMQLGSTGYCGDLYVAPLQDQMLLGMEFLHRRKARLDLENGVMTLDRGTVPMMFGRAEGPLGAQVITAQPLRIPAASAALCLCHLDGTLGNFAVSPDPMGLSDALLIPHTYHTGGKTAVTCLVNTSDVSISIAEGSRLGVAWEAEPTVIAQGPVRNVFCVASPSPSPRAEVPDHLQGLLERSSKELTPPEREKLAELLNEFQDVFVRGEFDFGNFTALEHEIDTGDARPVKERMRHTPTVFRRGGGGAP
jgi:hypothetical protein